MKHLLASVTFLASLAIICAQHNIVKHNDVFRHNVCTMGKSMLCQSKSIAILCRAVAYCQKHVWPQGCPPSSTESWRRDVLLKTQQSLGSQHTSDYQKSLEAIIAKNLQVCLNYQLERQKCIVFVRDNTRQLVQSLRSGITSQQLLARHDGCLPTVAAPTQVVPQVKPAKSKMGNDANCATCKTVIGLAYNLLALNATQSSIESVLTKLCGLSSIGPECGQFVAQLTPIVITFFESSVPPERVCHLLNLCPIQATPNSLKTNVKPVIKTSLAKRATPVKGNVIECEICINIVNYMYTLLENPKEETEIEQVLDKVCHYLPHKDQNACVEFVLKYTPVVIELIEKEASPRVICTVLTLCLPKSALAARSSSRTPPAAFIRPQRVVVERALSFGVVRESFVAQVRNYDCQPQKALVFCLSREKALKCGSSAVEICKKFYWK